MNKGSSTRLWGSEEDDEDRGISMDDTPEENISNYKRHLHTPAIFRVSRPFHSVTASAVDEDESVPSGGTVRKRIMTGTWIGD